MPGLLLYLTALAGIASVALPNEIIQDPGRKGPPLEIVHLYNDLYPQGMVPAIIVSPS